MNNDNLRNLYKTFEKEGYEMPSYEDFEKDMQDDNNLHDAWETLKGDGYEPPEYDTFKTDMGFGAAPEAQPAETVSVSGQGTPQVNYSQAVYDRYENQVPKRTGNNDAVVQSLDEIAAEMEREKPGSSKPGFFEGMSFEGMGKVLKEGGKNVIGKILGFFGDKQDKGSIGNMEAAAMPTEEQMVQHGGSIGYQAGDSVGTLPDTAGTGAVVGNVIQKNAQPAFYEEQKRVDPTKPLVEQELMNDDRGFGEFMQHGIDRFRKGQQETDPTLDNEGNQLQVPLYNQEAALRGDIQRIDADVMRKFNEELSINQQKAKDYMKDTPGNPFAPTGVNLMNIGREANKISDPSKAIETAIKYADEQTKDMPDEVRYQVIESLLGQMEEQLINERIPSGTAEYVFWRGFKDSDLGRIMSSVVDTNYEKYLDQVAASRYKAGFWENLGKGAVTLASDMWEYMLPAGAAGKAGKWAGGKISGRIMNDLIRRGVPKSQAARIAERLTANSVGKSILQHGASNAVTFGTAGAISGAVEGLTEPATVDGMSIERARMERDMHMPDPIFGVDQHDVLDAKIKEAEAEQYSAKNLFGKIFERAAWGVGTGIATSFGAPLGEIIGHGRGVAGKILGDATRLGVNATAMTGVGALEQATTPGAQPLTFEDLLLSEANNLLTFGALEARGIYNRAKNYRNIQQFEKAYDITDADKAKMKDLGYGDMLDAVEQLTTGKTAGAQPAEKKPNVITRLVSGERVSEVKMPQTKESSGVDQVESQNLKKGLQQLVNDYNAGRISEEEARKWYGLITGDYSQQLQPITGVSQRTDISPEGKVQHFVDYLDAQGRRVRTVKAKTEEEAKQLSDDYRQEAQLNQISALEDMVTDKDVQEHFTETVRRDFGGSSGSETEGTETISTGGVREKIDRLNDLRARKKLHEMGEGKALTAEEERLLEEGLSTYERDVANIFGREDQLQEALQKQAEGGDLLPYEESLIQSAQNIYRNHAGHSKAASDFAREFEKRNGMEEGTLSQILEKKDRSEAEQKAVDDYVTDLQEYLRPRTEQVEIEEAGNPTTNATESVVDIAPGVEPPTETPAGDAAQTAVASEAYSKGQAAVQTNDAAAMRNIGYEMQKADARMSKLFTDDEAKAIYDAVESGDEDALAAVVQQHTEPAKRDAIEKLKEAHDAMRGVEDAINDSYIGNDETIRAEIEPYQNEQGEIVPLTLSNGSSVYYVSGDLNNAYGTVMVAYIGEDGSVRHAQVPVKEITETGTPVGIDDYVQVRAEIDREVEDERYKSILSGTELRKGNQVELTMGNSTGMFTVDGFFGNGDVQLRDENGGTIRMTKDEALEMMQATEDKRINQDLADEQAAYKEAERVRQEEEKARQEAQRKFEEERRGKIAEIQKAVVDEAAARPQPTEQNEEATKWNGLAIADVADAEGVRKYLLDNYESEADADTFMNEQRRILKSHQRDEIQPEIDKIRKWLDDYTTGKVELSDEELRGLITQLSEWETEQNRLNGIADALKNISDALPKTYAERNAEVLKNASPYDQRMAELSKAKTNEDKVRIVKKLYGNDPDVGTLFDDLDVPADATELVSMFLKPRVLRWEGVDQGGVHLRGVEDELGKHMKRGVGRNVDSNNINTFLAAKGEGKTVDEFVHDIWESPENHPVGAEEKRFDDTEIRNALINLLLSAKNPTEIRDLIIDGRIAEAERILKEVQDREEEYEMQSWAESYHLPAEERENYEDYVIRNTEDFLLSDEDYQKLNTIFAEQNELRDEQNRRSQEMDRQPIVAGAGGEGSGGQAEVQRQGAEADVTEDQGRQVNGEGENLTDGTAVPGSDVSGGAQGEFERSIDELGRIEEEWNDKILDYVSQHYPTQAVVSAQTNSPKGKAERKAMLEDPVYQEMVRQQKEALDAADKKVTEAYKKEEEEKQANKPKTEESKKEDNDRGNQSSIQGIEGYDADEVLNAVRGDIEMKLEDAGIDGVTIKGLALNGSRMRGDAREDSDLDVVVEYEGNISEDGLFNILNDNPTTIEGITVDINPITKGKSGTLEEYMKRSQKYDEEKKEKVVFKDRLAAAIEETNTEPTEGQKEAGNYKKGHLQFGGYNFTVENPKGSVRSGKDASGKPWSITMHNTYGYLTGKGHLGKDGDHLDVFINDDADLDNWNGTVFVVDQVNSDGSFDEHKIMYGFDNEVDALRNYLMNYSRPWHGMGNITGVDKATFDKWVESSNRKQKPFAETRFGDNRDVVEKVMGEAERRQGLRFDKQGNPVDADGQLITEKVERIEDITDTDFTKPTRSIELPKIPQNVNDAIGAEGKPVIIKKNIFEKNAIAHHFSPNESRNILISALYNPDLVGQSQPKTRKNHWVAIKIDEKSPITVLEVNQNKENVEVVGWYTLDDRNLTRIKRQAEREDGELLILTPKGAAASLSTLPSDLSAGKDINKSSNLQEKGNKNAKKNENKIEDVGEVIAGARKDMRRKIAESIDSATEKTLIDLPFSKAYKKPDLKKAVEEGALREEDATFYDAFFSTMVNPSKPKVVQSELRMKKWKPDYKTKVERWAEATHEALQVLKEFVEATEEQRDEIIRKALENKYPMRDVELAEIEKRKEWNKDRDFKAGDKTTPNPLWVTYEVMKQLDYKPGEKLDIPYGLLKADAHGTGYYLYNAKNETNYNFHPQSVEDGISDIVWLAKLKRGDADIQHPISSFSTPSTKSETGETGRYRVIWGGMNIKTRDFDNKKDADEFAASRKQQSLVSPIREVVRRFGYKVVFRNPLTNDKIVVDDQEFDTKDEAQAYLEDNYDELNEKLNTILSEQRKDKKRTELKADDLVFVSMVRGNDNKWTYGVIMDKKYANYYGMPRVLKEGFATRDEAKKYAESIKDEVFSTYKNYKTKQKNIVYFDTGENSRLGEDYRGGKDVSAEDFMNTFGFRGVQFGNWTNQADRQMAVNQAYDAFLDLAKLIGVSPQALSLNGELGIAFGARGVGGFAAHYEPGEIVINLTKTQGAGSLAHEWWHALDNYFARAAGEKGGMVTDDSRLEMRPELRDAYNTLTKQVAASKYFARSKAKGDYWGRMHEVTARLLAEWVDQGLKKRGELNTFLSRGVNTERTMENNYLFYEVMQKIAGKEVMPFEEFKKTDEAMSGSPYPSKAEVDSFADAMRNIFDVMQERKDEETGNIMLYEPDFEYNAQEPRPRRRNPKVVSHIEGNLFPEEKEGELFDDKKAAAKPQPTKKPESKLEKLSDEQLLEGIGQNANSKDWDLYIDEYDKRHRDEYQDALAAYSDMLEKENVSLEDAYGMYADVAAKWNDKGFASDERSKLMAQVDALEEYVDRLESEAIEREEAEEEEAAAKQQPAEKKARYEEDKTDVRAHGYDLTKIRLRELGEGEVSHVERRYVENGSFSFTGGEHIESAADVAYIFRQLEDAAVENSFMVLIKDGVPTVIHLAIGSYNAVHAPIEQAFAAYKEIDPDNVIFLHNHPSGNLKASREDLALQKKVEAMFGRKALPGIIINTKSGKYAEFNSEGSNQIGLRPKSVDKDIPVRVFNFSKQVFAKDWNPETAFEGSDSRSMAAFVSSHRLGDHNKMSLIVMDQAGHITGNIFLPWTTTNEISKQANALQIATYVNQMGGRYALIYGNTTVTDSKDIKILKTNLDGYNVKLRDVMTIEGSAHDKGLLFEPDVEYKGSAKDMMEAVGKQYHGKEMVFLDKTNGEEQLLKDLGMYDEVTKMKGSPEYDAIMEHLRKNLGKAGASYNRDTKKIYIFAPEMTSSYAEEAYFHENIHAILDDWYGDGKRTIAERFWNVMPDDGKVNKAYVKEKSTDKSEYAEEAFAYWLSRSMQDGDVAGFLNYFDEADKERINNILKTFGYDAEKESGRRVRLRRNQHVSEAQSGYSETHQGTGGEESEGSEGLDKELPTENPKFSIRHEAAPKKTGIGYKVFVLKDGKLYPPMVANPGGEDTPVGVWLNADAAPVSGTSKTGRPQVKAGGKGTQGGSGQLAYRPGWHLGDIPYALQFGRKDPVTGERTLFPNNFVWAEVEYANDVDYQEEAYREGVNANGKYIHALAGLKHLPVDGSYRYRTNPNPETDPWIITGAMKVNRILKPSEVDEMVRQAGRDPQPRQEGAVTDEQVEKINRKIAVQTEKTREAKELATKAVMQVLDNSGVSYHEVSQADAMAVLRKTQALRDGRSFHVDTPVFVSNALKAVEGIRQEKATPEQWLAMIQKNGGLKAGEDKWLGLSDWLKEQASAKRLLTKNEVLDYIRENQIQVEETNYKEYFDVDDNPQMQKFRKEFDGLVEKYESEKNAVEQEANTFNDEMYQKYGGGWANDPERLSEKDRKRNDDMVERWNSMNDSDPHDLAFLEMVDNYGDDFEMAFEVNYGNGNLEPQMDMYDEEISDAAKHFLQFEDEPINSTRLSYTTEGLENKKEIALTVPTIDPYNESDNIHFGDAGGGRAVAWIRFGETTLPEDGGEKRRAAEAIEADNAKWYAAHQDFARYGIGDADGSLSKESEERNERQRKAFAEAYAVPQTRKVLVIDEIQSKRHQDGREKGYKSEFDPAEMQRAQKESFDYGTKLYKKYITEERKGEDFLKYATEEEKAHFNELNDNVSKLKRRLYGGIPDAPFEKNWHELALKRMLRYAAENGYDKVAWTKGEQQAERYNLGGKVKKITARDEGNFGKVVNLHFKENATTGMETMNFSVDENGIVKSKEAAIDGKQLSDVVGKDLAEKIMSIDSNHPTTFNDVDLSVGGEGMKGFYDQMIPRFMDKYGKKWGVKTGEVELPGLAPAGKYSSKTAKMWAVDVTPEMKESVMQGQPMFSVAGKEPMVTSEGVVYGYTDGKDIYLTDEGINPETPAHEYGHLWVKAIKKNRPDLWNNIKDLMREDEDSQKIYQKLLGDDNYNQIHGDEDELYEEVLTNMGGAKNRERFEQAAREVLDEAEGMDETMKIANVIRKIRRAFRKLWDWIGKDLFGIKKFKSVDEVTDRMMYDFVEGTDVKTGVEAAVIEQPTEPRNVSFQAGKGKPRQKKGEGMASYFNRLREWERRKMAEEDESDPMPIMPDTEGIEDFEELKRIQDEYRKLYQEWEVRHGIADLENAELGLYDVATGKKDVSQPTEEEQLLDQEIDARVLQDIGNAVGYNTTPEGARKQVKYAVINRRKNLESASAEDAIFIHDLTKRLDDLAETISKYSDEKVTGKMLREALPDIIEGTYGYDFVKSDNGELIRIDNRVAMPIQVTPELQKVLDDIKDWYDEFYHVLEDAGLRGNAGYIAQGYVNHIWDKEKSDPKAWKEYVENYQRTKSPNMKKREIPTYAEGIAVGLVPKFTDITDIMSYYSRSNNEAVANRKFLDDLACINIDELNKDGEVVRSLPLITNVEPFHLDKESYTKPYDVPGVGDVWVHKAAKQRFASVFGTMRTADIPDWVHSLGKGWDVIGGTAKKIQLSFSGFHAGALTEVALAQMRPDKGMRALMRYVVYDSIKKGTIPAYAHPEDFKLAAKHLVNLGATADYAAADVNMITEKLRDFVRDLANEQNLTKKSIGMAMTPAAAMLDFMNKGMDKVLWNYIHDGFKIACFKMFAEQVEKRLNKIYGQNGLDAQNGLSKEEMREQLLDEAGQYVNDTFGGQYWELLSVTPAQLKWMRRALLSPDWLVSTQRHFLANFGIGSLYNEGGFLEYMRYNADNLKRAFGVDIPRNELRRFRSKNAKQCYILGVCVFFYSLMNAINAIVRKSDEDNERMKAEEIRKTDPNYRSPYELAYPEGMKWYDYTMYGNTIGQQTHLLLGRYKDGTEWYARWGKQFREFPELFMGRHGVEFPAPMIERMMGKSNPMISYIRDGLGTLDVHGFDIPYQEKETVEKYGKEIAFLSMTAKHFLPFSVPTQADKEFKTWDLVMPSQKGFTRWKAVDFFKTYINAGDMHGIERTYHAAVMNNLNAEECLQAAIASVKATQKKELVDGVTDLPSAFEAFDNAKTLKERQLMRKKIIQYMTGEDYRAFTMADAREKALSFWDGDKEQTITKDNDKYIMQATSEDIRDDYKMDALYKKSNERLKQLHEIEDAGKDTRRWENSFGEWIDIHDMLLDYRRDIKDMKKDLDGSNDKEVMDKIRKLRKEVMSRIDNMDKVE